MKLAIFGLGRMGMGLTKRLVQAKHEVIVWNRSEQKVQAATEFGAKGAKSPAEAISQLPSPKIVWLMLPNGEVTETHFLQALEQLRPGDILIDGGNSQFNDSVRRHSLAQEKQIRMLDIGVSGGLHGEKNGYAMMIGGDKSAYEQIIPALDAMCMKNGYLFAGEQPGSGHYVKMVHNAIEYGMMQAISEGFDLLKNGSFENLPLKDIAHLWNHGTIVSSFLMEMAHNALEKDEPLKNLKPYVEDNGEGRWAAIDALNHQVPFVVNSYALHARYISRDPDSYSFKLLAAIRNEFGGHAVKK
ncbi:MAG: phosphogluconate dehydrogenase (NAD(+)-dependent, decarboxylating) [Candidatus Woesearchaeota archaeon]